MYDVCIYHSPCADGFTAAWAVRKAWPDMEFIGHNYGQPMPEVSGKNVLIVDYSFKHAALEAMGKVAKSVTVIDHHKSAEADLQPFAVPFMGDLLVPEALAERDVRVQAYFDMDRSGAMLAWAHAHGVITPAPKLVQHVEDRDLWRFKLEGTREISANIFSYEYDFHTWDNIAATLDDRLGWEEFVAEGTALERKFNKDLRDLLPQVKRTMIIGGYAVPVANVPYMFASEAGNILSKGERFAACYYDANDGLRRFSLRAQEGGLDVSQIAVSYGGGGHAKAAGFAMPLGWEGDRDVYV